MLTKNQVLEGITYSTNNLADLEEKNVLLFLDTVEKETKLSDLFGSSAEKALRKFELFPGVQDGLSKLSKKKLHNIPSFDVSGRRFFSSYEIGEIEKLQH